jgi:hypothetical protein
MNKTDNTTSSSVLTDTESEYSVAPPEPPKKIDIGNGKFEYIENQFMRHNLQNGWQAVTITESWHYLKNVVTGSFMWSRDPKISEIGNKMEDLGALHSGASFGFTMRDLEYIAKHGETSFKSQYLSE